MEKWLRLYLIILVGLIGSVASIVLISLSFSAYGAKSGLLGWSDLNSVGGFWNGHLGLITLLVIAIGLYVQARQFDAQLRLEQQERSKQQREHYYNLLQIVEANINQLKEGMYGYVLQRDESGKAHCRKQKGLSGVLDALRMRENSEDEDYELWVNEGLLYTYVQAINGRVSIHERIIQSNKEFGSDEPIKSLFYESALTGEQEISNYLAGIRKQQDLWIKQVRDMGVGDDILNTVNHMVEQGWRLSILQAAGRHYVSARCFAVDREDEVRVDADAQEPVTAYTRLTENWKRIYL